MRRVRNDIQAQLLVLRLFPDSLRVTLRAEGRLFAGPVRSCSWPSCRCS